MRHGNYQYRRGCRCAVCTEANTRQSRERRHRRALVAIVHREPFWQVFDCAPTKQEWEAAQR